MKKKLPLEKIPLLAYLEEFDDILLGWDKEKMAIGGLWALRLHGLNVRNTEDLDIIVYQPTYKFISHIQTERGYEPGSIPEDRLGNKWRSFKITRNGLTIDFIMEHDEELPKGLLRYPWKKGKASLRVQRVNIVIEAKKAYDREKDHIDLYNFKQSNF